MEINSSQEMDWQFMSPEFAAWCADREGKNKLTDNTPEDAHLDAHAEMDCGE